MIRKLLTCFVFACITNLSFSQEASDLFQEAKAYYDNSQYREALNLFDKSIAQDSTDALAFKFRGNCYYELNHTQNAISDYQRALLLDAGMANVYYNLGNVYEELEVPDSAEYYFRKFTTMKPSDPEGYIRLGSNLQQQDKSDSVRFFYEHAYALDSMNLMTIHYLGWHYFLADEYSQAIRLSINAKKIDSLDINYYLLHGLSSFGQGDFKEAINQSNLALSLDSLNFDAYSLGLEAQILNQTDQEAITRNEFDKFKFTRYNSNNLHSVLKQDSLINFEPLFSRMKDGEVLSLEEYFLFYVAQSQQSSYSPYYQQSNPKISEHFNNQEYMELSEFTEEVLTKTPLKLDDIYKVSVANYMTRNMDDFRQLYAIYYGLMEAILATGTGNNYDSAYIVVSAADEYSILNYMSLSSGAQSLQSSGGHSYDILESVDQSENTKEVYFNIDMPFGYLNSSFSGGDDKKKKKKKRKKRK